MTGEPRQPSYVDLSDGQQIRFGGECGICAARYASVPAPIDPTNPAAVRDLRKAALSQFDASWRDLQVSCYRCGRGACPECWDSESRMCVECADARALTRAPYIAPTRGPLADGRLVLTERGKYSRVEQPSWVGDLIASGQGTSVLGGDALGDGSPVQPWMLAITTTGDLAREVYPDAPYLPVSPGTLVNAPTELIPTAPNSQPLPPPVLPPDDGGYAFGGDANSGVAGAAGGGMVTCPRCGTANFDFVTQCTSCQLQLIQICPNCEKLNPGQSTRCEFCGAALNRPRGWSGVLPPLSPDVIAAMKREANAFGQANALQPASNSARQRASERDATQSTRVVPYLSTSRVTPNAQSSYTPGGQEPVAAVPGPPHERGKRRRKPTLAPSLGAGGSAVAAQAPSPLQQALYPPVAQGGVARVGAIVDRLSGWILVAVLLVVIGMVAAAEISPGADAALRGIIHIDIRQILAQFGSQMQMLWQRLHH